MNSTFQTRQPTTGHRPLTTFKILGSQRTAHLLVREDTLIMNPDCLCDRHLRLDLHQPVDSIDHSSVNLIRIGNKRRQPRRYPFFRKKLRDLKQTINAVLRAPLDANILPEGATEFGRNLVIAMVAGALVMGAAGAIAGAFDLMLGMGVGMGLGLGFLTGVLMGLVGAMQAGTRVAKAPLRALEPKLTGAHALLVIEVEDRREAVRVVEVIERNHPLGVDTIGGW